MIYWFVLLCAFGLTLLLTPIAAQVGRRFGMVDAPGGRRQHKGVIPRTGGLAIFGGFFLTVLLTFFLADLLPDSIAEWLPPRNDPNETRRLIALMVGSLFCVVAGFLDDRYQWSSAPQYVVQFVAALIAGMGLIFIKHINNPFGEGFLFGPDGLPWWLVWPITVFWFMGMMNTINWLDGLSGLVAGVTVILCAVLAIHMLFFAQPPQLSVATLPLALLGAALGFLPLNFIWPRLFMGSSGSYFLGFAIASLGIIGGARLATVVFVLGMPILDVAWLIWDRWRRGVAPGQGGRDHLHFRLLDRGLRERTIVYGYWAFCAAFGGLTLLVDQRFTKLLALLVLGALGLAVLVWAAQPAVQAPLAERPVNKE